MKFYKDRYGKTWVECNGMWQGVDAYEGIGTIDENHARSNWGPMVETSEDSE